MHQRPLSLVHGELLVKNETFNELLESVRQGGEMLRRPRIVIAYGTRPEQIKLAPVAAELRAKGADVLEWCSGQSRDLVDGSPNGLRSEFWRNGLVSGLTACLSEFEHWLRSGDFDAVIVQGDTATAFACAQAAFLASVPVAHVEAGLRTYADEPWPEEAFRRAITAFAKWHFCPDEIAALNVKRELGRVVRVEEGLTLMGRRTIDQENVFVTGNTVIDTLPRVPFRVLVTLHRRENWGARIEAAADALHEFAQTPGVSVAFICHPNMGAWIEDVELWKWTRGSIEFTAPLDRDDLLDCMRDSHLIVTDSGGLQEEAAHFGVPTLVLRTSTERTALTHTGAVVMVHPDHPETLREELETALAKRRCYGDGTASTQIAEILCRELSA